MAISGTNLLASGVTSDDATASGSPAVLAGLSCTVGRTGPLSGLGRAERLVTHHLSALGARLLPNQDADAGDDVCSRLWGEGVDARCRLAGWGDLGSGAFTETLVQARCGLMAVHGRANGGPSRLGVDLATVAGSVLALQGLLAGVLGQLRGADVQHIEIGVASAALLVIGQYLAAATADEDPEKIAPDPAGRHARPPFVSADGVTFEMETLSAEPWQRFWAELGAAPSDIGRSWTPFLLRFARGVAPLAPGLHDVVGGVEFGRITEVAERCGISICRVRTVHERRADPDLGRAPWSITPIGAPTAVTHPPDGPLPLSGLRVVESCRRVQGPLAGQLLAMLGADVVRVEPPGGDPLRGMPPMAGDSSARFVALNRAKEIVEVDIKSAAGRQTMYDLAADADVFVHNWAPGRAARLGLDSADLARVNPGLVYAYPSGWGDVLGETPPLGTDFMVQAWSGVGDVASSPPDGPRPSLLTVLDVLGGLLCAEGVLAGLIARHRTGRGRLVGTSLLTASTTLIADELAQRRRTVRGCGSAPRPVDTVFDTADRPLAVSACSPTIRQRLMDACGIPGDDHPDDAESRLAPVLATEPAEHWAEHLRAAGVPCEIVATDLADMSTDDRIATALTRDLGCALVNSPWSFR